MARVRLEQIRKSYGAERVVDIPTLEIADGEFFSLLGPSGCGKTTTLRMIAGLVEPTEGVIEVHGRDVTTLRPHKRPVNTVFQQYALFPHLSIFDNVAFGLQERKVAKAEIARRVGEMLELVDLTGRGSAKPAELHQLQRGRDAGVHIPLAAPAQAEGHVLRDVEVREEGVALEDGVHRALVRLGGGDVAAADEHAARRRRLQARDHPQHRGLAAPGGPE